MAVVMVTHVDQSKNGKDRVFFNGKNNWQDAYYVKQGLHMPAVGMTIEADTSSQTFPGARQPTWFLNGWKEAGQRPASAVGAAARNANGGSYPPPSQDRGNGRSQPTEPQASGWNVPTGDLSRYVSNIVGSAIAAGLIKKPSDIWSWAREGYATGNNLTSGDWGADKPHAPDAQDDHGERDEFDDSSVPF